MASICDAIPNRCTVKCRLGVGDDEDYDILKGFVETVHQRSAGRVEHFIIHARRAILGMKLTPGQNRSIPPLRYDLVYRLKSEFPNLRISINGGVQTLAEAKEHLKRGVDGVMIGRAAYRSPWDILAHADSEIFGDSDQGLSRREVCLRYCIYADRVVAENPKNMAFVLKPVQNLFAGAKHLKVRNSFVRYPHEGCFSSQWHILLYAVLPATYLLMRRLGFHLPVFQNAGRIVPKIGRKAIRSDDSGNGKARTGLSR